MIRSCPVPPTCSYIDEALSDINDVIDTLSIVNEKLESSTLDHCIIMLKGVSNSTGKLEELRTQNSELREWGEDQHEEAGDYEEKYNELRDQVETLESDLEHKKYNAYVLDKELTAARNRINELEYQLTLKADEF